jgi:hypothetical protein
MSASDWFWAGWLGGMLYAWLMMRRPAQRDGPEEA